MKIPRFASWCVIGLGFGGRPSIGCYRNMSDKDEELTAIPRLAEEVDVTPRVVRYWEEQGLISPSREHGRLRYSPRDHAIARHVKRLLDTGVGIDGIRALRAIAEREVRGAEGDERTLEEVALRLLYARKAFREVTGTDEDHFPDPMPIPPHERDGGRPTPKPPQERHGKRGEPSGAR
jgi:DNA-binding transcriptional MerR regulator